VSGRRRKPRLFAELFAGSAAVTLQLLGGVKLGPPIAYMGSKRGYGHAILDALGLAPGSGADAVLLCDGGPWGWAWQALADPSTARAVAEVLRSWRDEDPTALWRRIAAEPPPEELVKRAATVLWLQGRCASNVPLWWEPARDRWEVNGHGNEIPHAAGQKGTLVMAAANGRVGGVGPPAQRGTGRWVMQSDDGKPYQAQQVHGAGLGRWLMAEAPGHGATESAVREKGTTRGKVAGLRSPVTVADRVEAIAEAFARWIALQEGNHAGKPVDVADGAWKTHGYGHLSQSARDRGFRERLRVDLVADQVEEVAALPWGPQAVVNADVITAVELLPDDLTDCVIYLDPPYQGATRYACECERDRVLDLARDLDARGAHVAISEAEPMPLDGWHVVEITHARKGIPRTASKLKREFLTLNRPPVRRVAEQVGLFARTT